MNENALAIWETVECFANQATNKVSSVLHIDLIASIFVAVTLAWLFVNALRFIAGVIVMYFNDKI